MLQCIFMQTICFSVLNHSAHRTSVDCNNVIWTFQLSIGLKYYSCGIWYKSCCYAVFYIYALCIFTSATGELSDNTIRYGSSSDMKGEERPQFLLISAELTVLVLLQTTAGWTVPSKSPCCVSLKVITVSLNSYSSKQRKIQWCV